MPSPPVIPASTSSPKNLRLAGGLNLFLPGAGLFYLGHRRSGIILASSFLFCFVAEVGIFIVCYGRYLSLAMSEDLMKNDNLEKIAVVFPRAWLVGFALGGVVVYLCSMALFSAAKRRMPNSTKA
jgi:hypothetical protein